jgi:universal stress protein A
MISTSKILVPVDFSEASREALAYATELGARLGAEVDVLHVFQPEGHPISRMDLLAEFVRSDAGHEMMGVLGSLEQEGRVEAHGRVAQGGRRDVPEAIVDAVQSGHYDLLVMATHGRDRLSLALRRGVTNEVIRRAPCPVVAVRGTPPPSPSVDPLIAISLPW